MLIYIIYIISLLIRVFVDNKFLFENLQINKQNCKSVYLTSGGKGFMHSITVDGFYNGGEENTGGVVLMWQGPGTQNKLVPVQSADATGGGAPRAGGGAGGGGGGRAQCQAPGRPRLGSQQR